MDVSVDMGPSVPNQWSPTHPLQKRRRSADKTGLLSYLKWTVDGAGLSSWFTLITFVGGDLVGLLSLAAAVHLVTPWIAPEAVGHVYPVLIAVVPIVFLLFAGLGFYRQRFVHPAVEMKRMVWALSIIAGTAALTSYLVTGSPRSAFLVAAGGMIGTLLLPFSRLFARVLFSRFSWWGLPTVVVSSNGDSGKIIETLETWPEIGLRPVAWLGADDDRHDHLLHGEPELSPYLAEAFNIPAVIVSGPDRTYPDRAKRLAHYSKFFDQVLTVPSEESPALWSTGDVGDGLRGYGVCNAASTVDSRVLKRTLDLVLGSLLFLLLSPLFVTICVLIRTGTGGPIFYRQERLGRKGRTFTLLKFRSMHTDADERLSQVLDADPSRRRQYEKYHKLNDDPRVTEIGEILRHYSLDELPQLLNVIRGDMSLVGPRAYVPRELPKMKGLEKVILQTPPGITGLWQVSGRNELPFEDRVDLDVHYVQNWSVWLDLYLLVRTVPTVLTGEGAA